MKRIGILVYDVSLTGGAERVAINLTKEFSKKYYINLISVFNSLNQDKNNFDFDFSIISSKTLSITKNLFYLSKKLKKIIKENDIDLLISITAGMNTLSILSTIGLKTKVIYCEHSNLKNKTYGKKHIFRQYIGAKCLDKVVTLTEKDKHNFINDFNIKESKITNIPNWFEAIETNVNYNLKSKRIISVGRLEKVKGYDMLIKVAKLISLTYPDWHWDIYGEGTQREKIQLMINENNLDKFITLKGNVKNLISSKIYNKYSIYVMTSYFEGLPLGILEAKTFKLPVVSFDCQTGPSELITNDVNGYLIPTYDIELMACKINELIKNEKLRISFSNKSDLEFSKYLKDNVLKQWYELIDNM